MLLSQYYKKLAEKTSVFIREYAYAKSFEIISTNFPERKQRNSLLSLSETAIAKTITLR